MNYDLSYVAISSENILDWIAVLSHSQGSQERLSFFSPISHNLVSSVVNPSQSSHICRTFWLTEIKSRRVRDRFETTAPTLRLFWEKICRTNFLNMFKIQATPERRPATHARRLRTTANDSRHFGESRSHFVASCRSPVRCRLKPDRMDNRLKYNTMTVRLQVLESRMQSLLLCLNCNCYFCCCSFTTWALNKLESS